MGGLLGVDETSFKCRGVVEDVNYAVSNGFYLVNSSTTSLPSGATKYGVLIVYNGEVPYSIRLFQIYISNTYQIYIRHSTANTTEIVSSWTQL